MKASGEDDVCLVTNLPRYRCDHCIAKDPSARAQVGRTITTTTTTARYKGQCNFCHDPIEIGDRIRRDLERAAPAGTSRSACSTSLASLLSAGTFQAIGRDRTCMFSYLPL